MLNPETTTLKQADDDNFFLPFVLPSFLLPGGVLHGYLPVSCVDHLVVQRSYFTRCWSWSIVLHHSSMESIAGRKGLYY